MWWCPRTLLTAGIWGPWEWDRGRKSTARWLTCGRPWDPCYIAKHANRVLSPTRITSPQSNIVTINIK
jgi:hypothetical protein